MNRETVGPQELNLKGRFAMLKVRKQGCWPIKIKKKKEKNPYTEFGNFF